MIGSMEEVVTGACSPNTIKSDFSLLNEILREFACQTTSISTIDSNDTAPKKPA